MYSKHRLWLVINSLENIPSIDNRLLYADTLDSLNRNIYNLKLVQIPDLNNVYERNYNELKQLLYQKYLDIIKDTEAGLADLIMQDLMDKYQSQIVDTYTVYVSPFMIGGDASRSGKPPSRVKISNMPSLAPRKDSGDESILPPPPPPPPPPQEFSKADYDRLNKMSESKLTTQQLLDLRNYEIKTQPISYTGKTVVLKTVKSSNQEFKDVIKDALKSRRQRVGRTPSGVRLTTSKMPDLIPREINEYIGMINLSLDEVDETSSTKIIDYSTFANQIKRNLLLAKNDNKLNNIKDELNHLIKNVVEYLNKKEINRENDRNLLLKRLKILEDKLKEKLIPLWRYNYEVMNNILNTLRPPVNIDQFPKPKLDAYKDIITTITFFNTDVLNDKFKNTHIKLFDVSE